MFQELKSESNEIKDKKIKSWRARNSKYFRCLSDKCKIIFPSTHVIYEGY